MNLTVISGPSGAGKTTLVQILKARDKNIIQPVTCTTRAPKDGEVNGVHYHFLSRKDFMRMVRQNCFLEYAEVHGNLYGTTKESVEHAAWHQKMVLILDCEGAASVRRLYPNAKTVFITAPVNILGERLRVRGLDSEEMMKLRLENAAAELERVREFDHVIENEDRTRAAEEILDYINTKLAVSGLNTQADIWHARAKHEQDLNYKLSVSKNRELDLCAVLGFHKNTDEISPSLSKRSAYAFFNVSRIYWWLLKLHRDCRKDGREYTMDTGQLAAFLSKPLETVETSIRNGEIPLPMSRTDNGDRYNLLQVAGVFGGHGKWLAAKDETKNWYGQLLDEEDRYLNWMHREIQVEALAA